jgi:hypothetical protein
MGFYDEYEYSFGDDGALLVTHKGTGVVVEAVPKGKEKKDKEPLFYKFYFANAALVADAFGGKVGVLFYLASWSEGGRVVLTSAHRKLMAERLGLNKATIYNYMSELLRDKMVFKMPGETAPIYWLNPHVFGYGAWSDVKEKQALFEVSKRVLVKQPDTGGEELNARVD